MLKHVRNAELKVEPEYDKEALRDDPEIAWGAREVAAVVIGVSADSRVNRSRQRRVYRMYEKYRKACSEAMERKRPSPPNPTGWIIRPDTNRVILSIRTYRAFVASQLNGGNGG